MFRAGLTFIRRFFFAAALLVLLVCGAEVAVRVYEASTGDSVCSQRDAICSDPSQLTIPSWSFYQELKPLATAQVECRDSNSLVEIKTNSLGLRGPELAVPKPAKVYRSVIRGDETLYAPETPEGDHFCTILQDRLQQTANINIEVINAAIPGHCPLTEFLLFKQRIIGLQPDLVLLHFDWSDVADDRQIRRLAHCNDAGVPLSCPHVKLTRTKKAAPHEIWRTHFRLFDWGLTVLGAEWKQKIARQTAISRETDTNPYAFLRDERPERNLSFRRSVGPIADLSDFCRSVNIPFALLTSPKPWQVSEKCSRGQGVRVAAGVAQDAFYSNRAPFDVLARFADRAGIPFIDGSMVITSGRDAELNFLRFAPRWSAAGHLRLAELTARFLHERIAGPWNPSSLQQNEQPLTEVRPAATEIQQVGGQRIRPRRVLPDSDGQ